MHYIPSLVFEPASRTVTRKKLLHLDSVEANVDHGEAVSGVIAMIKCLALRSNPLRHRSIALPFANLVSYVKSIA